MAIKRYVSSAWQDIEDLKRYQNSAFESCESAKKYENSAWVEIWKKGGDFYVMADMEGTSVYTGYGGQYTKILDAQVDMKLKWSSSEGGDGRTCYVFGEFESNREYAITVIIDWDDYYSSDGTVPDNPWMYVTPYCASGLACGSSRGKAVSLPIGTTKYKTTVKGLGDITGNPYGPPVCFEISMSSGSGGSGTYTLKYRLFVDGVEVEYGLPS